MARNILRMFSACCCWSERSEIRPSLVTPSTSCATSGPNSRSTSSAVSVGVLDGVVQERGRDRLGVELEVGKDAATSIGWLTYSSPDRRRWPVWAVAARSYALLTMSRSAGLEVVGDPEELGNRHFVTRHEV